MRTAIPFTPIGESTAFTGTFDGLGNTISNLTIDDTTDYNVGLFGQVGQRRRGGECRPARRRCRGDL